MACGHSGLSPGGHTHTGQISGAHRPPPASPSLFEHSEFRGL